MTVKELITKLLEYNMEAKVGVIANFKSYEYSITYGGAEGVEKHNTQEVSFYVDELCDSENIQRP